MVSVSSEYLIFTLRAWWKILGILYLFLSLFFCVVLTSAVQDEGKIWRAQIDMFDNNLWQDIASLDRQVIPQHFTNTLIAQFDWTLTSPELAQNLEGNREFRRWVCAEVPPSDVSLSDAACVVPRILHQDTMSGRNGAEWTRSYLDGTVRLAQFTFSNSVTRGATRSLVVLGRDENSATSLALLVQREATAIVFNNLQIAVSRASSVGRQVQADAPTSLRREFEGDIRRWELMGQLLADPKTTLLSTLGSPYARLLWPPSLEIIAAALIAAFYGCFGIWLIVALVCRSRNVRRPWRADAPLQSPMMRG